ncbi:MAG TPA: sensor histidine kinase [Casimicrobiaceae bacterium]|nr:sensor histidine kinase [Casimicrobiaceae bacterium]
MSQRTHDIDEQLTAMAVHLRARRSAILQAWHRAVDADHELTTASSLPRTQFNDHIPDLLDAFERVLRAWPDDVSKVSLQEQREDAAGHGLQRWQQGYHLREVTREWGHLQLCLIDELDHYATQHPEAGQAMVIARRAMIEFCNQGISASTLRYFQLQQTEAVGHVRDLDQTLAEVRDLELRRSEVLRQAAHDLRGNLGVVTNATLLLTLDGLPEGSREEYLRLLKRSVASLQAMLDDVMNLARLQAGHELRNIAPFDAAVLIRELCESVHFLATERDLFLEYAGPPSLPVEGDAVKVRRIAQNLLLNALRYTNEGGVTVTFGDSGSDDPKRWKLVVHDTGPGFHAGPGAPLAGALEEATTDAQQHEERAVDEAPRGALPEHHARARSAKDSRAVHQERGEGVGLSIVKRLCELLDASLELESKPGEGTTFRVLFPRHYDPAAPVGPAAGGDQPLGVGGSQSSSASGRSIQPVAGQPSDDPASPR